MEKSQLMDGKIKKNKMPSQRLLITCHMVQGSCNYEIVITPTIHNVHKIIVCPNMFIKHMTSNLNWNDIVD